MTDLTGRVAVVTGSARGIGKAIALRYASVGARVVINYSRGRGHRATHARRGRGRRREGIVVRADLDRLFTTAIDTFGSLGLVVANAGREVHPDLLAVGGHAAALTGPSAIANGPNPTATT